jgi:hypothetical protein
MQRGQMVESSAPEGELAATMTFNSSEMDSNGTSPSGDSRPQTGQTGRPAAWSE